MEKESAAKLEKRTRGEKVFDTVVHCSIHEMFILSYVW